jgi:hypothetical protein
VHRARRRGAPALVRREPVRGRRPVSRRDPWPACWPEYRSVRQATITLFSGLPAEAWRRRGIVCDYTTSVRGLAFHIAGHELRHMRVVREKYLRLPPAPRHVG